MVEFSPKAILAGLGFGVLFGSANAYLGLKAGLTVSTSIPIAVLSVAMFRLFRGGTILEANLSQTIGSASSSLASGTIFTIPALYIWGYQPSLFQVAMLALLGGLLGIFAMIPLRRLLIVKAHAELPYPEGQACAQVLETTAAGKSGGKWIFLGIGVGFLVKLLLGGLHIAPDEVGTAISGLPNSKLALSIAPALLAVGYIVGFKAAAVMVAGGLLSALVLYPLITKMHAIGVTDAAGTTALLTAGAVKSRFMNYIGAGAVAAAGMVTILRTAPMMAKSFTAVVSGLRSGSGESTVDRKDQDLPGPVVLAGLIGIFATLVFLPGLFAGELGLPHRLIAALGVMLFGFLFVPVSSRLVGVIGVSSNPVSAMALITLAAMSAIFAAWHIGGDHVKAAVLTIGTVVCVAASKAGDISQDLKTGFLVGGTPSRQQFGQVIAAFVACWAVAAVVTALGQKPGFVGEGALAAPQANLMKTVIEAVTGANAPWEFVGLGALIGGIGALAGLPPLPFALGIYLPLGTMVTIFLGGLIRRLSERPGQASGHGGAGILCASGMVAGEGLAGVLIAAHAYLTDAGRYAAKEASSAEIAIALGLVAVAAVALNRAAKATQ